ncbi:hypothetical protein OIE80_34755 (plasmid) [Streptomyces cellulosae]|nr:hypothetical protein OG837_35975 [Streptomyces cellulosae]
MDVYRAGLGEAQAAHQAFVEAVYGGDLGAARVAWGELVSIADRWRGHPDFPGLAVRALRTEEDR